MDAAQDAHRKASKAAEEASDAAVKAYEAQLHKKEAVKSSRSTLKTLRRMWMRFLMDTILKDKRDSAAESARSLRGRSRRD